jgi:putative transposase
MVQRRCSQRQLLLTPTPVVEQVFTYCVGLAAQRFSMEVFSIVVMGNHYHLGVVDRRGKLPRFMALLNSLVARAMNMHLSRGEAFWSSGSYSAVALGDADTILDKIVYMIVNPVEAGLVAHAEDWPGLITLPSDLDKRELVAERPKFFFRTASDDEGAKPTRRRASPRDVLPDKVSLRLTRPPGFEHLGDEAFRKLVKERVDAKTAEIREQRRKAGKSKVVGRKAVLRQKPTDGPGNTAPDFQLNPRLACKDKWRAAQMAQDLVAFWTAHREAAARFRAGKRRTRFPEGTYWYRVHFGARCHCSPTA